MAGLEGLAWINAIKYDCRSHSSISLFILFFFLFFFFWMPDDSCSFLCKQRPHSLLQKNVENRWEYFYVFCSITLFVFLALCTLLYVIGWWLYPNIHLSGGLFFFFFFFDKTGLLKGRRDSLAFDGHHKEINPVGRAAGKFLHIIELIIFFHMYKNKLQA